MRMIFMVMVITLFNGCSEKAPLPPKLETLRDRPPVDIDVTHGCICDQQKDDIMNLVKDLRGDIKFYKTSIEKYNANFPKTSE